MNKQNFDINDEEKNTLFKSTIKCILSYGRDAHSVWSQLSKFCSVNACNVNIFEMKDSLN